MLFSSIATQGVPPTILERAQSTGSIGNRFIERYRVEVAGENDNLQYITPSAMSFQPAVSGCHMIIIIVAIATTYRYSHWDKLIGLVALIDTESHYLDQ